MGVENPDLKGKELNYLKDMPKEILDNLEIRPSQEIIESDIKKLKNILGNEHPEFKENYEKSETFYAGLLDGKKVYGMISWSEPGNIGGYFFEDGTLVINLLRVRDPFPGKNDDYTKYSRQKYIKSLQILGYKEIKSDKGIYKLYKVENNGNKLSPINQKSYEYFKIMCKSQEIYQLMRLKSMINHPEKGENAGDFLERFLFWKIISFKDIEILKQNDMLTQEQFDYAKEKIKGFFFRLVYVGLADREQLEDASRKNYIDAKTYKRCDYYLKTGEFLK